MLTPEQIDALRDFTFTITDPVNNFLISDICRRIAKAGKITDTAAYQIYRAQALGESKRAIKKMLAEQLGFSNAKINKLFRDAAEISYMQDVAAFDAAPAFSEIASVKQTIAAAARLANDEYKNITQTIGMVSPSGEAMPLQKVYRACMDDAFNKVYTGATDYTTAIRHASRNIAEYGARVIEYESGAHISIEAGTRRNMMGGLGLMVEDITHQTHDALECDGWELSAHAASAPDHEPYQGRQFTDAEYLALNGTPENPGKLRRRIGTLNCGHVAFPIILGVHRPQYTAEQLSEFKDGNNKGITYQGRHYTLYEAKQKLRELERNIRLQKRRITASDALEDRPKVQTAQIRLGLLRREYAAFAKAAGMRMEPERTWSVGFGHSAASKAAWAYRKSESSASNLPFEMSGDTASGNMAGSSMKSANKSYAKFANSLDEPFKSVYAYYHKNTTYQANAVIETQCRYNGALDVIEYNPSLINKKGISVNEVITHELTHRYDRLVARSWESQSYLEAFSLAQQKMIDQLPHYQSIVDMGVSPHVQDLFCALSNNRVYSLYGHAQAYWERPNAKESEGFADIAVILSTDTQGARLIKTEFSELVSAFEELFGGI